MFCLTAVRNSYILQFTTETAAKQKNIYINFSPLTVVNVKHHGFEQQPRYGGAKFIRLARSPLVFFSELYFLCSLHLSSSDFSRDQLLLSWQPVGLGLSSQKLAYVQTMFSTIKSVLVIGIYFW